MMRSKLFLFVILSMVIITSCEKSIYTERERSLFITPIFDHDVNLDSINTLFDIVVYFDQIYCEDNSAEKWPVLYFDLEKKEIVNPQQGKNILAIGIEPSPCSDMIYEYDFSRILEVVKDGYNLEVEQERIEIDTLYNFVTLQYLNYGKDYRFSADPLNNGIWLIADKNDKLDDLNIYIAQLIEGFVQMAQQYAQIEYGKRIDQLTELEFTKLKNDLVFHLSFKYTEEEEESQIKMGY